MLFPHETPDGRLLGAQSSSAPAPSSPTSSSPTSSSPIGDSSPSFSASAYSDDLLSPTVIRQIGEQAAAFELKFLLSEPAAVGLRSWAASRMQADAYGDPARDGSYQTTTLYLDTSGRDVLHRTPGFRHRKFRIRRYGSEACVYLERKTRRGDRVRKRRSGVVLDQLPWLDDAAATADWAGDWFRRRIALRGLRPVCRVTYDRTAFVRRTDDGPIRLTFDRRIRGRPSDDWDLTPLDGAAGIYPDQVVCEFKFRAALPALFKEALQTFPIDVGGVSKYRRIMLGDVLSQNGAA